MITTRNKKEKFQVLPVSNWSVSNYGVQLIVNSSSLYAMQAGESLDVEDNESGEFVGIGIYSPSMNTCFYWSDWFIARNLHLQPFIAHNGRSDLAKLNEWGFNVNSSYLMWDTQLMAHILDSSRKRYSLKKLAKEEGISYPEYEDITGKKGTKAHTTLDKLPLDLVAEYNAMDCYATYRLYLAQKKQSTSTAMSMFNKIEKPAAFVFQEMEERGIRIDMAFLKGLKDTFEEKRANVTKAIHNDVGPINLNSPKQVLEALHAKNIAPEFKGKPSTDKRALERFKGTKLIDNILQSSQIETLLSAFVNPYLERNEEVVHPSFNQCGTRTGRPSCNNPNLLQIPRRSEDGKQVRKMFIPRDGCLFGDADYKEGEPRMLAHLSQDPSMLSLFNQRIGFHDYFASHLNIDRDRAKVFDLETYYRATKFGVARHLNCSLIEAQKRIDEAWQLFPTLYDWENEIIYNAKKSGYITTLMGRRIKVEDLDSNNEWRRSAAERQAMNNIAQASLQECTKLAMIEISKAKVNILVQVYDEILFEEKKEEIEEAMIVVIDKMENTTTLSVPLVAEGKMGTNWSEVH